MTTSEVLLRTEARTGARYSLLLTADTELVRSAQRLRHRVFTTELGADLPGDGVDADPWDAWCEHLVVRDDADGAVVGTYRLLPPARAAAAGGLYADGEFDLGPFAGLRERMVEAGRSCVHPDHRSGAVVGLVWAGLARYMLLSGNRWLVGCASVPLADGGALAAATRRRVEAHHLAPPQLRVRPRAPWDPRPAPPQLRRNPPPLMRGYLRLGAWVCGPPAHDPAFDCADFLVLLDVERIGPRYLQHFLGT